MRRDGGGSTAVTWLIVIFAAVPASAAAGLPLWLTAVAVREVVTALQSIGYATAHIWVGGIALSVCLVALKFLMPIQAAQYSQQGLHPPVMISVTWACALIASVVIVMSVGSRIILVTVQLSPSWVPVVFVVWLSIEVVGTLGLSAASLRPNFAPPPPPASTSPVSTTPPAKRVSALSAEDLLAWLQAMLKTPEERLPKGIKHFGDGETLITSERKLARALNEPRTRVVRLLKRLEGQRKIYVGASHVDTHIRIPGFSKQPKRSSDSWI